MQSVYWTSKTVYKNNIDECFRYSTWPLILKLESIYYFKKENLGFFTKLALLLDSFNYNMVLITSHMHFYDTRNLVLFLVLFTQFHFFHNLSLPTL